MPDHKHLDIKIRLDIWSMRDHKNGTEKSGWLIDSPGMSIHVDAVGEEGARLRLAGFPALHH